MPATITKNDDVLSVDLSTCGRGTDFMDTLEKVKLIPGRRYDPENKLWTLPATVTNAERLQHSIDPYMAPELAEWIRLQRVREADDLTTPLPDDAKLKMFWAEDPYPFQRALIDLIASNGRMLVADDMGLGKTIQAIGGVSEFQHRNATELDHDTILLDGPKLVACPNSVKGVWAREVEKWLRGTQPTQIIDASSLAARHKQLLAAIEDNAWAIVNWEQLQTKKERKKLKNGGTKSVEIMKEPLFETTHWMAAIADEAHRAKNRKAARTRGLWRVEADIMLALTGTPIMNSPDELWAILRWLWPDDYHERGSAHAPGARAFWTFYEEYVDYTEGHWGKQINGVKNPDALRFELRNRLARRTKDQVLDLPDKTRVYVPVDLPSKQAKLYEKAETQMWLDIEKDGDKTLIEAAVSENPMAAMIRIPNGASRMVRLQQLLETPQLFSEDATSESGKMDACQEIILDNQHTQHVVWTKFVETTNIFAERLRAKGLTVATYSGKVPAHERTQIEDDFQAGKIDVIVGTIAAMKEGITLTAASTSHFLSRSWVPAENEQAEDREHRVGQHHPVTVYIYEAPGTVDDGNVRPTNRLKERIVKTVLPKDHIGERTHS